MAARRHSLWTLHIPLLQARAPCVPLPSCVISSPFQRLQKTSPSLLLLGHPLSSSHIQRVPFSIPTQPLLPLPPCLSANPLFLLCPYKRYLFIILPSKAASFPLCHIPSLHFLRTRMLHFLPTQGARCTTKLVLCWSGSQAAASSPSSGEEGTSRGQDPTGWATVRVTQEIDTKLEKQVK